LNVYWRLHATLSSSVRTELSFPRFEECHFPMMEAKIVSETLQTNFLLTLSISHEGLIGFLGLFNNSVSTADVQ
jgi:hypothetical protein